MPYKVGEKGSYGCSGYPAVKDDGEVMGCHTTRAEAAAQIYAINRSEGNIGKSMPNLNEGDFAMTGHGSDEFHIGQIVHVMRDGSLGNEGTEYYMQATAENPAVLLQLFEQEDDGFWEATRLYTACMMSLMIPIDPLPVEPKLTDVEMAMDNSMYAAKAINKSMYRVVQDNPSCSEGFAVVDEEGELEGCFATREEATIFAEANNKEEMMDSEVAMAMYDSSIGKKEMANAPYEDDEDMDKAKPNYEDMIKPRRGGSTPSNPRLYERVIREAKDRFDTYPSAVANAWVVGEYKRRGGTYKGEDMDKRDYSMDARRDMAASGMAMPDGSFPIANGGDLQNAIQSVGRASNYAAAKEHIVRRARALDMMDMLPEDWRNNATKGMGQWSGSIFDLNPFVK
jgi:hypothetical protein